MLFDILLRLAYNTFLGSVYTVKGMIRMKFRTITSRDGYLVFTMSDIKRGTYIDELTYDKWTKIPLEYSWNKLYLPTSSYFWGSKGHVHLEPFINLFTHIENSPMEDILFFCQQFQGISHFFDQLRLTPFYIHNAFDYLLFAEDEDLDVLLHPIRFHVSHLGYLRSEFSKNSIHFQDEMSAIIHAKEMGFKTKTKFLSSDGIVTHGKNFEKDPPKDEHFIFLPKPKSVQNSEFKIRKSCCDFIRYNNLDVATKYGEWHHPIDMCTATRLIKKWKETSKHPHDHSPYNIPEIHHGDLMNDVHFNDHVEISHPFQTPFLDPPPRKINFYDDDSDDGFYVTYYDSDDSLDYN